MEKFKDQFIKERIEEFERAFEYLDMSYDVGKKAALTWLSDTISQAYDEGRNHPIFSKGLGEVMNEKEELIKAFKQGEMTMLEKVEGILKEKRFSISIGTKKESAPGWGRMYDYTNELLRELKKLKDGI